MTINLAKFSVEAIRTIDELRSTNADPKKLRDNSAKPMEPRINTFYRAIGLPAFSSDDKTLIQQKKFNNGNLHENTNDDTKKILEDARNRNSKAKTRLSDDKKQAFLDNTDETILNSAKKLIDSEVRIKTVLFPMVVDGDVKIYPQTLRVGGAFMTDAELTIRKIKYRRPLIETIILLRLRKSNFVDSNDIKKLNDDFKNFVPDGFFDDFEGNLLTISIIRNLANIITDKNGIFRFVDNIIEKLSRIRAQSRITFNDSDDPNVAEEQPAVLSSDELGILEKQKSKSISLKNKNDIKLTLLDFDDTATTSATKNMRDSVFGSTIVDMMLADSLKINERLDEIERKQKRIEQALKAQNKNLDIVLGTFSGISGLDILSVITAMFLVPIENLIGLLNEDNLNRLKIVKKNQVIPDPTKVLVAIDNLESKTKTVFEVMDKIINGTTDVKEVS